jgi:hypothetical protein
MKRTVLVTAVAILAVFAPNLIHFGDAAIGGGGSDALKHVWSQWFVHNQLLSGDGLTLQTRLIHHPSGGAFFSLDTVNALMGFPFRAVFGSVATYNLVVVLNLFLAALAGALLTQELTDEPWAAELGGLGFALSAWVLCFPLASGVSETAAFWFLPLILLAALRTWKQPGYLAPVICGVLLCLQGLACWSHGITAGLLLLGLAAWSGRRDRAGWTDPARLKRFGILLATTLVAVIPLYLAVSGTVSADDAVKTRTLSLFHSSPLSPLAVPESNSMAILDFFLPGAWGRRTSSVGTEQLMYAAHPGFILLGLAFLAFRKRIPQARLLWVGLIAMALMSLGPRIYLDQARTLGGMPNPVYLAAYWLIPLVNASIHSVDRFAVGVQLCVALLAALGLTTVARRWRPWLLGGVVVETLLISPGPWPISMVAAAPHPVSTHIAASAEPGAVIDLPFLQGDGRNTWFLGDVFLQQTFHGKPSPFQLEGHGIETANPLLQQNPYFRSLSTALLQPHPTDTGCDHVSALYDMNFTWIVWRPTLAPDAARASVEDALLRCLELVTTENGRMLFQIPATP